jgi:hypothetical protein
MLLQYRHHAGVPSDPRPASRGSRASQDSDRDGRRIARASSIFEAPCHTCHFVHILDLSNRRKQSKGFHFSFCGLLFRSEAINKLIRALDKVETKWRSRRVPDQLKPTNRPMKATTELADFTGRSDSATCFTSHSLRR